MSSNGCGINGLLVGMVKVASNGCGINGLLVGMVKWHLMVVV